MDLAAGRMVAIERRAIRHVDPLLIAAALGLAVIGCWRSTRPHISRWPRWARPGRYVKRQLTFLALAVMVLALAASFDYRLLKVYAGIVYVSSLVLLILVRTPIGTSVKGRPRWFEVFGFQLAPSEVAKLALIAMLAAVPVRGAGRAHRPRTSSERPRSPRCRPCSCSCSRTSAPRSCSRRSWSACWSWPAPRPLSRAAGADRRWS
jgi:cell division protein FtsW (lipid II flippase)